MAPSAYLEVFFFVHVLNALVGQGEHLEGLSVERHLHRHKVAKYFLEAKMNKGLFNIPNADETSCINK